jgi:hypothetical protein
MRMFCLQKGQRMLNQSISVGGNIGARAGMAQVLEYAH